MQPFQILDRKLDLKRHYFLEASAGTGKTFSIQNIVARLLIDNEPIPIHRILVVTFTRSATRELKQRIRNHIQQSYQDLYSFLSDKSLRENIPDYLIAIREKGHEGIKRAQRLLQHALATFDTAQIFTIHGFCSRMLRENCLESGIYSSSNQSAEKPPLQEINQVIRDFLRTEISHDIITTGQLSILINHGDYIHAIRNILLQSHEIISLTPPSVLLKNFNTAMSQLKSKHHIETNSLIKDFEIIQKNYNKHKTNLSKNEILCIAKSFAALFGKNSWSLDDLDQLFIHGLIWSKAHHPALQKKNNSSLNLNYPNFTSDLIEMIEPIIIEGSDYNNILATVSKECKKLLKMHKHLEECSVPDDLLHDMNLAVKDVGFRESVLSLFDAAIIDEFQDTDPIQWSIFKGLFADKKNGWKGYLYLVGDPKQSIYSFRQADIYTYLSASHVLGEENCCSLDTNYRSHPKLVEALNCLFNPLNIPNLIPLPKKGISLPYRPVKSIHKPDDRIFSDEKMALHIFIGEKGDRTNKEIEQDLFFPFIANEIITLKEIESLKFNSFTVLVKDRYQAQRLSQFFIKKSIPFVNQRGTNLAHSPILSHLIAVLNAVINPKDVSHVKTALSSFLIGLKSDDLNNEDSIEEAIVQFYSLKKIWEEESFGRFFNDLQQSRWKENDRSILENLLVLEDGRSLYEDLLDITDIIMEEENKSWYTPESLISFLDQFKELKEIDDERMVKFANPTQEGVKIITLHYSKGLEFDIVFALGLVNRHENKRNQLIPAEVDGKTILMSPLNEEFRRKFNTELDAEKMRQLYVAMTRAKSRLYLPMISQDETENDCEDGSSPMELFVRGWGGSENFLKFLKNESSQYSISYSYVEPTYTIHKVIKENEKPDLVFPSVIKIKKENLNFCSFSGLSKLQHEERDTFEGYDPTGKTLHSLPLGKETGIVLHKILEEISFDKCKKASSAKELNTIIKSYLSTTSLKGWDEVIGDMVYGIMKNPLLSGLNDSSCYKEMPFLFPYYKEETIEGLSVEQGFIKGVIDLIYSDGNQYYIVDWKSNWIGPEDANYSYPNLKATMERENYFLQAALYKEALKRYLRVIDPRPFEDIFGGCYYVFLRGIENNETQGVIRV